MCDAGWALCGHETPAGEAGQDASIDFRAHTSGHTPGASPGQADGSTAGAEPAHDSCSGSSRPEKHVNDGDQVSDDPLVLLSRTERMALGQKCKQLIDAGRVLWLAEQGFQASLFSDGVHAVLCSVFVYDFAHEALTSACASFDYTSASFSDLAMLQVQSVLYVDPKISGENRLLLATRPWPAASTALP